MDAMNLNKLGLRIKPSMSLAYILDERTPLSEFGEKTAERVQVLRDVVAEYRTAIMKHDSRTQVTDSGVSASLFLPRLQGLDHEEVWVAYVNRANRVLSVERLSVGSLSGASVSAREIVKRALDMCAGGIIMAHNHPSGTPYPRQEDIRVTEKLRDAARLFDISLDHIITGDGCYYSFADESCTDL